MEEEDGLVDSDAVQIRSITLEILFAKQCWHGEGIRLELLHGNPGGLELRAAMKGCPRPVFMLTFKRGDGSTTVQHGREENRRCEPSREAC